jgi:hypothetical protein
MYHLNRKQISAGKDPMGIAATALYIAPLQTLPQFDFSRPLKTGNEQTIILALTLTS